jgi:hypothetical protein
MKQGFHIAALTALICAIPLAAQDAEELPPPPPPAGPAGIPAPDTGKMGEVLVSANRANEPYAQQNRPVIGLRRRADSIVIPIYFTSDSRDLGVRKTELYTMLDSAITRAAAANLSLAIGVYNLVPVTKANYKDLPLGYGGRTDTNQIIVLIKAPLTSSAGEAENRITAFLSKLPRSGRGTIARQGPTTLTVINPDQYRSSIIKLVAADAKEQAAVFGPDFTVQATGIDAQVAWSQISASDVFLYIPYRYTILPRPVGGAK